MAVGGETTFQDVPFHSRARGDELEKPGNQVPTLKQNEVPTHETPVRSLAKPGGLGLGVTAHCHPFHASINVDPEDDPTATQRIALAQLIAVKELKAASGPAVNDHPVPFHRSMTGPEVSEPRETPTAKQTQMDRHETPVSALPAAPAGSALGTIFQAPEAEAPTATGAAGAAPAR